eukprot:81838-Chlamydomonas_euryale.AAC.3
MQPNFFAGQSWGQSSLLFKPSNKGKQNAIKSKPQTHYSIPNWPLSRLDSSTLMPFNGDWEACPPSTVKKLKTKASCLEAEFQFCFSVLQFQEFCKYQTETPENVIKVSKDWDRLEQKDN